MGEGHVTGPHVVEHPQYAHVAVDGVARLNPNEASNLTFTHCLDDAVRVCDICHVVLVVGNQSLDDVILLHEELDCVLVS